MPDVEVSSSMLVSGALKSAQIAQGRRIGTRRAGSRHGPQLRLVADRDECDGVLGEPLGVGDDAVEDRLDVESGGADGVEHVGHGGLAFEGGVEVVEEPCVRDGERGLVGERLEDREFGVVERTHLIGRTTLMLPIHSASLNKRNRGVAPGVRERLGEFGGDDVEIVECQCRVAGCGVRVDVAVVGWELHADRHVGADVHLRCGDPENRTVLQQDAAEGCVAQAGGLRHDRVEHGRQVAGMGADQPQRLGRRGLQFQRLGQGSVAFLDLGEQSGVVDGDRGLVGECLQQTQLVVGVSAGLLTVEVDDADRNLVPHERNGQAAPPSPRAHDGCRGIDPPGRSPSRGCAPGTHS